MILRPVVWDLVLVFLATAKYHVFPQLLPHMTPINSPRILPMLHLWRPWRVWALDAVRSLGAWSAAQHLPGCWQDPAIFSPNGKCVFRVKKKQIKKITATTKKSVVAMPSVSAASQGRDKPPEQGMLCYDGGVQAFFLPSSPSERNVLLL